MKTREFSGWHALLAIAALLALTVQNTILPLWQQMQVGMLQWTQLNQLYALTQCALPLLTALTGSIFLLAANTWNLRTLWTRIIPIAVLGCVFWWGACAVIYLQQYYPSEMDLQTFSQCLGMVLTEPGNIGYSQMLVSMFMLYPLLRRIVQKREVLGYCLLVLFLVNLLLPLLQHIPIVSVASLFFNQLNWGFFRTWAFYLLLGAYLTKYPPHWPVRLAVYCAGIISVGLSIALTSWLTKTTSGYCADYIGMHAPLTALQTAAIFLFASQMLRRTKLLRLRRSLSGLWMCVPVTAVIHSLTSRFLPAYSGFVLPCVMHHALTDSLLTMLLIAALNVLPGFRFLVGYHPTKGESR